MTESENQRLIELETMVRPLTDKEYAQYKFLMKKKESDKRIDQFRKNQQESYESKRSRAWNLAWEFYKNIDVDGQCYVAVGGLDSIVLYLFLRSIGIRETCEKPCEARLNWWNVQMEKLRKELGV